MRAAASGLQQAERRVDEARDRKLLQLERERAGVDPRELEQVVDERASASAPGRAASAGSPRAAARPSSIASIIACIEASGVRRSWLAQATSSRRASKSCSMLAAIALNDVGELRDLARRRRSARARRGRRRRAAPRRRRRGGATARSSARAAARRRRRPSPSRRRRRGSSGRRPCGTSPSRRRAPRRAGTQTETSARPASWSRTVGAARSA